MNYYGSLTEANDYFANKLYSDLWFDQDPDLRVKAMKDATLRLDRLNFIGVRTDSSQELQFPRNGSNDIPVNIKRAVFEIAFQLLDGRDPEIEYNLLRKQTIGVGPGRASNDTKLIPIHVANGIPSLLAWSYIKPYLRDKSRLKLQRS